MKLAELAQARAPGDAAPDWTGQTLHVRLLLCITFLELFAGLTAYEAGDLHKRASNWLSKE